MPSNTEPHLPKTQRRKTFFEKVKNLIDKGTDPLVAARLFIDIIDKMIIDLLGMRHKIVTEIVAPHKEEMGLPAHDEQREEDVLAKIEKRSRYSKFPVGEAVRIYRVVIDTSTESQIRTGHHKVPVPLAAQTAR